MLFILLVTALCTGIVFLVGWLVMLAWNNFMFGYWGLAPINIYNGVAIAYLTSVLSGGFQKTTDGLKMLAEGYEENKKK